MNTTQLIHALGGSLALANHCDGEISEAAVRKWGNEDKVPAGWQKYLRLKLNRQPEHKAAWVEYDKHLAEKAKADSMARPA